MNLNDKYILRVRTEDKENKIGLSMGFLYDKKEYRRKALVLNLPLPDEKVHRNVIHLSGEQYNLLIQYKNGEEDV